MSFDRLRQKNVIKCVLHVQHDYFSFRYEGRRDVPMHISVTNMRKKALKKRFSLLRIHFEGEHEKGRTSRSLR